MDRDAHIDGAAGRGEAAILILPVLGRADLLSHFRTLLATGALRPGDRLPNERQISEASGLSRSTVRAVLADLEREGRLSRHVGRGTYVTEAARTAAGEGGEASVAAAEEPMSPGELMEFRAAFEPALVDLIVVNATDTQLRELGAIARRGRDVDGWQAAERADRSFHEALHAASRNRMAVRVGRGIAAIRDEGAWMMLKQRGFSHQKWAVYQAEHEAIAAALESRDADLARSRLRDHLLGVRANARPMAGDI